MQRFFGVETKVVMSVDFSFCILKVEFYVENCAFVKY